MSRKPKKYSKMITLRVTLEEEEMLEVLRKPPYFINISDFLRASIRNIYKVKVIGKKDKWMVLDVKRLFQYRVRFFIKW